MVESVNKIKAYRDGQEREFTPKAWEAMGIGHCGWTAVPEVPKEVTEARLAPVESVTIKGEFKSLTEDHKPRKTRKGK